MTDKNIKRYQLEVEVEESGVFMRKFPQLSQVLTTQARDEGYVPLLDLPTWVTVDYRQERFHYIITVQAVFVGKRKAWDTEGMLNGHLVQRSTRDSKSEQ